ncbi:MAG: NADH-quinone oxidoreductase subunit C/D [Syntrophobacteraceae bacterium]|nr:NADH-quinone oxidoreductase subunit C/D [Syntrophobacteraceae bacterium]
MNSQATILDELKERFGAAVLAEQPARDAVPTLWVESGEVRSVLKYLKSETTAPYRMLYDLTAIDERLRSHRDGQPEADFSVIYHLLSLDRNADIRVKTPLKGEYPSLWTITDLWSSADWYEREVWDMFGIVFEGRTGLRRILLPPGWEGHPLRKEHPARATEMEPFSLPPERQESAQEALRFRPEEWGLTGRGEDTDLMFLNLGPQHPGAHGVFRVLLQLDGEEIVGAVPEIGFHHRGAEKMAERQTWHTFIPYTDRIDYLGGVMNNLPYVLAVEKLAGIEVPDRVKVIRVMMVEFFRIASHLVWYGTFAQDLGMLSPVFFTFNDRERIFDIVKAVMGGRMHPMWFRIGGVAQDLPQGWEKMVREFLPYMVHRLKEYDRTIMRNRIFKARTMGIGSYSLPEAIEWGVTGPGLRACGLAWDLRKKRPYSGYDQFDFEIPTAKSGDCYGRSVVRVEEMRQSLRIIEQCVNNMPPGSYKALHPLTTPPLKEHALRDIETLITHFLGVSWGPVIPPGEVCVAIEATKGWNSYYLVSDGSIHSYRTRIRTPSFAHVQMIPLICRGFMVADLLAILGSIDYVMADVDR